MADDVEQLKQQLLAGFDQLTSASPQDSSKGRSIKEWFEKNFKTPGKASLVNESKQAYNRPKEQLGNHDVAHAIFVIADPKAFSPLVKTFQAISYEGLQTVLLVKFEGGSYTPTSLYETEPSPVGDFYRVAFPDVEVIKYSPKISSGGNTRTTSEPLELPTISDDDVVLVQVLQLLEDGFAGVIFSGSPGTSKSWYARQVALSIVEGNLSRLSVIQFHPGYQYEDFIEGYIPNTQGGFSPVERTFLSICRIAEEDRSKKAVVVIDELSRTDVIRVFGEALTYLESSKRDIPFTLASGKQVKIPQNLVVLCTMNPWDRGVDELDLALERRFAKIGFEPSVEALRNSLVASQLDEAYQVKLEQFFFKISRHDNRLCRIGHAYFMNLSSLESLHRLWNNQLVFHFERVLRDSPEDFSEVKNAWLRIFAD